MKLQIDRYYSVSLPDGFAGTDLQVLASMGDGWYEVTTFSGKRYLNLNQAAYVEELTDEEGNRRVKPATQL